jgi:hypothetical protein
MGKVQVLLIIFPLIEVKNGYVLNLIKNKEKCPYFGNIETNFKSQTQWDHA